MASLNKITDIFGAIKTIYPYYAKDVNVQLLTELWGSLLKPYPDEVVDIALHKCLSTCKVPPTPADIIEAINGIKKTVGQSDEELWSLFCGELRKVADLFPRFAYTYIDASGISQGQQARDKVDAIFEALPEKVKRYVASKGELIRMAREANFDREYLSWEKQRFMKSMPIMEKRMEFSGLLLDGNHKLLLE